MQTLHDALVEVKDREEKNSLIAYIAFAHNPHLEFIELIELLIGIPSTSTDPLLLAYGSLASRDSHHSHAVEGHIVKYLLHRLAQVEYLSQESTGNDTIWPIIHLLHSLGNTDSKLTIETLLSYVQHPNLDIQLASINALKAHTTNETVQRLLSEILLSASVEDQVEHITQTLIEALEHMKMSRNKDRGIHDKYTGPLVASAMRSTNSKLHNLVLHYLNELGTKQANEMSKLLMDFILGSNFHDDREELYDLREVENSTASSRHRRGSDWDASSSIYNLVASYSSRRSDVTTYPKHKAYIWGKKIGISKVYAQFAAGGFAGIRPNGKGYKLFAKAVARGHAFGKTVTALRAEFLRRRTGNNIYQKIYAKVVGKTLINEKGYLTAGCSSVTRNLFSTNIRLFRLQFSVFIYVGTLDFYVTMNVKLGLKLRLTFCETTIKACASLIPSATLRAEGGARATILVSIEITHFKKSHCIVSIFVSTLYSSSYYFLC